MKQFALVLLLFFGISVSAQTTFDTGTSRRTATITFNGLGSPVNGEIRKCLDCTVASPTTGGGTVQGGVLVQADGVMWFAVSLGGGGSWGGITGTLSSQTDLQNALNAKQASNADLTAIAALAPANDDFMQRKSGAWANRTVAQVKSDLQISFFVVAGPSTPRTYNLPDANSTINTGTGTTNALLKFLSGAAGTTTNSQITDDGTTVIIGAGTTAGGSQVFGNATGDTAASFLEANSGDAASNAEPAYLKLWSSHTTKRKAALFPCTDADGVFCISSAVPTADSTNAIATVGSSNSWADGVKQTFNPNATNAGVNIGSQAGDPSTPANGDFWYNSSTNKYRCHENSVSVNCIGAGGGGDVTAAANFANDNRLIRSDGTTKGVQASGIAVSDTDDVTGVASITTTGSTPNFTYFPNVFSRAGTGSPEGVITASPGATWRRTDCSAPSTCFYVKETGVVTNTGWVAYGAPGGAGAPATATYITQTPDGGLSAEQALSALSSGIMRVATTTGVITSLGDVLPKANLPTTTVYTDQANTYTTGLQNLSAVMNFTAGLRRKRTGTAISYQVLVTDGYVGVTDTTVARTITLPDLGTADAGFEVTIADESNGATANPISIVAGGSDTFLGGISSPVVIDVNNGVVTLIWLGTSATASWRIK